MFFALLPEWREAAAFAVEAWAATNTQQQLRGNKKPFYLNNKAFRAHNAAEVAALRRPALSSVGVALALEARPADKHVYMQ